MIAFIDSNGDSEIVAPPPTGDNQSVPPKEDSWIWRNRPSSGLSATQVEEWSKTGKCAFRFFDLTLISCTYSRPCTMVPW